MGHGSGSLWKLLFPISVFPGCDISQRNEVEKSSSFESPWLLVPTVVLMARIESCFWTWGGPLHSLWLGRVMVKCLVVFLMLVSMGSSVFLRLLFMPRLKKIDKLRLKSMVSVSVGFAVVLVQSSLTSVTVTLSCRKKYCVMSDSPPNTFAPHPYLIYVWYCLFILWLSGFFA